MLLNKNRQFAFKKMYSIRQVFRAVLLVAGTVFSVLSISHFVFAAPYTEIIKSIELTSQRSNYANNTPGSWHITKSAEWTEEGKARITFDVDTVRKTADNTYTDVIMVIDNSGSMSGDKMDRVKSDATELTNNLLNDSNNRIALVSFESTATKLSNFTNSKNTILNLINNLDVADCTNYYDGFKKAEEILNGYQKQNNRELIMLFLTDGYPNVDTPNEVAEYHSLKQLYPYMIINGIQYEMGDEILDPIKQISDNQFIANIESLHNVLFEAATNPYIYESFIVTDYIDNDYWQINSVDNIEASIGEASLTYENSTPKVTWTMNNNLRSGMSAKLTIDITLKDNLGLNSSTFLPTNKNESVISALPEVPDENITSTLTPVLKAQYNVLYEPNLPSDCISYTGTVPAETSYIPFSAVQKSDNTLACEGYNFNGWQITEGDPKIINDNYFKIMNDDVTLRATWSKPSITKSMDGTVKEEAIATLLGGQQFNIALKQLSGQSAATYDTSNTTITAIKTATSMSQTQQANAAIVSTSDSGVPVYAWLDDADGTIYIFSEADTIKVTSAHCMFRNFRALTNIDALANWNSSDNTNMSYMFRDTRNLPNINALANWDTSKVTQMVEMFYNADTLSDIDGASGWDTSNVTIMRSVFNGTKITNLDALANWDTSNVTDMSNMLAGASSLTNIDGASGWDTSKVTTMSNVFSGTKITNIDALANWDTSNVTDMSNMFYNASSLTNIDGASNWDTSKVTTMLSMFNGASSLTNIDGASNWDTSSVTTTFQMFYYASNLSDIDGASGWDTSSVTSMYGMFANATNLTNIDALTNWDTSSVTSMAHMFYYAHGLADISVVSGWDTSKVKSMSAMFTGVYGATDIDSLSNWDTSQVTDMSYMFSNANHITNIDGASNWDTSKVTAMNHMFSGATRLTNINGASSWDTSSVTAMNGMFSTTSSLTNINGASNWDTSNVTDMSFMFNSASSLTNINDISNWDTSSVTNMYYMFSQASSLADINGASSWDTSNVTNMNSMFYANRSLSNISAVSGWNTSSLTDISNMFYNDTNITNLSPLEGWDTTNITDKTDTFYGIPSSVARPSWY